MYFAYSLLTLVVFVVTVVGFALAGDATVGAAPSVAGWPTVTVCRFQPPTSFTLVT